MREIHLFRKSLNEIRNLSSRIIFLKNFINQRAAEVYSKQLETDNGRGRCWRRGYDFGVSRD